MRCLFLSSFKARNVEEQETSHVRIQLSEAIKPS